MKRFLFRFLFILVALSVPLFSAAAAAQSPVIRAVLFYSPTCPHCHDVMERVLPPLVEQYPGKLDIVGIDVTQPVGNNLYQSAVTAFNVPDDRLGVPTLVVGSTVLVGTTEIEETFPDLIQSGLAGNGFDWPSIPGLNQVLAAQPDTATMISTAANAPQAPAAQGIPGFLDRFQQDPAANTIAVVVLIGMIVAALAVLISYLRGADHKFVTSPAWVLPLLALIGLGVAGYMSYIEISRATAVCGPIGNCNSVQESVYATLFGFLPVGILGIIGYAGILVAWLLKTYGPQGMQKLFTLAIWGMAWFGVLFSIYLTFLEPFVIGATCAWCISSAILITLTLIVSTAPAKEALRIEYDEYDQEQEDDDRELPVTTQ